MSEKTHAHMYTCGLKQTRMYQIRCDLLTKSMYKQMFESSSDQTTK